VKKEKQRIEKSVKKFNSLSIFFDKSVSQKFYFLQKSNTNANFSSTGDFCGKKDLAFSDEQLFYLTII